MTFKHEAVVQPSLTTSDGTTQDFTFSGFGTPRAWIVTVILPSTEDSRSDGSTLGIGFCETSDNITFNRAWIGQTLQDGETASIFSGGQNSTPAEARAYVVTGVSSDELQATAATITDGIRLTYTTRPAAALTVRVDLLDCDDAFIESRSSTSGTDSPTTLGFSPNAGFFSHNSGTGAGTGYRVGLGFVGEDSGGNVTQCSVSTFQASTNTGSGARPGQRIDSTHFMGELVAPSFNETTWEVDSLDATGYTYTRDTGTGSTTFGALWIRADGIEFHAEAVSSPTTTGSQSYTSASFQAAGGFFGATYLNSVNTNESSGGCGTFGFGSWSGSGEGCSVGVTEDGADPSNASSYASSSGLCLLADDGTVGVEGSPSGVSGGYSIDFTTVDSSARYFMALVYSASDAFQAIEETEGLSESVDVISFGPAVDESLGLAEEVGSVLLTMAMVQEDDAGQGSFPGGSGQGSFSGVEEGQGVE